MKKKRIQKEQWYIELANELRTYKKNKARIRILETRMMHSVLPKTKLIGTYGEDNRPTKPDTDEEEFTELQKNVQCIEYALEALQEEQRNIIQLKFFENKRDIYIYEIDMPMSSVRFYKLLDEAMNLLRELLRGEENKKSNRN